MSGLKNLEIKAVRHRNVSEASEAFFNLHFVETILQTDTYFTVNDGRLKLREEVRSGPVINGSAVSKNAYVIRYDRTNDAKERICDYDFYQIDNPELFRKMFIANDGLRSEVVVKKTRNLALYKNARIHFDTVKGLDQSFVEIEVVIRSQTEADEADGLMAELLEKLDIKPDDKLSLGYREMLIAASRTI